MTISSEILQIIEASAQKAVQEAIKAIQIRNMQDNQKINQRRFEKVEEMLYKLPILKQKIDEETEDLEAGKLIKKSKSKDIVRWGGSHGTVDDPIQDYIDGRIKSIIRTELEVQWLERLLESISQDTYYEALEMKYFKGYAVKRIAAELRKDKETIGKNIDRLVNVLKDLIYG